jgi:site-specific DNA-methyltransferase (adenine-specific)
MNGKAVQFLKEKLRGEKVFLKFDTTKYDSEENLLCYLYLKNKTFINAHLIKNNLADVDSSITFKYKDKFLQMEKEGNRYPK